MANISIDPVRAQKLGNLIVQKSEEYKNEVNNLYRIISDLKLAWTGTAAQKFTNDIEAFKDDYIKFGKLINDYGELLSAIGKDYQRLEETL